VCVLSVRCVCVRVVCGCVRVKVCLKCRHYNSVVGIKPWSAELPHHRQFCRLAVGTPVDALGFWCRKLTEGGHMDDVCRWEDNIKMNVIE